MDCFEDMPGEGEDVEPAVGEGGSQTPSLTQDDRSKLFANISTGVGWRHAVVGMEIGKPMFGDEIKSIAHSIDALTERMDRNATGDTRQISDMLTAQATTLDTLFTEMTRRAMSNAREYPRAFELYAKLALKAQANSRATLEVLARLHKPAEQIVKHVHVNEGGQAIVADEFHQHTGRGQDENPNEQSHGKRASSAALPCPDPLRDGMPLPSREGEASMQNARRR